MNDDTSNLDERLRKAARPVAFDPSADFDLSEGRLSTRRGRVANPRSIRKVALGSGAGLASIAVASVVVTSVLAPPQDPLFSLAQSGGVAEMAASDVRIGLWVDYEYLAGEGLGTQAGEGPVYQLVLDGTPEELASRVADQFGLVGDAKRSQYFDENYPTYVVGSEDWTAPTVSVTWMGTGSWYYSNPAAYPEPVCQEVPGPEGTEETYYECENPAPTGALPSDEQAKAQAAAIFSQTGLAIDPSDVRVLSRDEWGVGVSAALVVDGVATALEWSMYWAPGPVIASASGHSIALIERGQFDTVSPADAVDRLESGVWWGAPGPEFYDVSGFARAAVAEEGIDPDLPVSSDTVEPESPGDTEVVEPAPEPLPVEPDMPAEPEVIQLTVTSSESTLLLVWDAEGNAWLVPGYVMRYSDDDWGWVSVISLIEGVIEIPEPMPVDIMPLPEPFVE